MQLAAVFKKAGKRFDMGQLGRKVDRHVDAQRLHRLLQANQGANDASDRILIELSPTGRDSQWLLGVVCAMLMRGRPCSQH
jgi:hypothetical protein